MEKNKSYQEKAHYYIPAGAHTYSRADDSYPVNAPGVLEYGKGAYVWDTDGNKYLDFGMALRAVTVGYANERISNAAIKQISYGNNLTKASKVEVDAAELLCNLIPSAEMVKFAKNGSTVTSAAVKLARAYTGRKYIARCKQHSFFSYDDWFIGDTVMNSGVPEEHHTLTLNFNYNDLASIEKLFTDYPSQIAAIIMEPVEMVEPENDFLKKAKILCEKYGALLILDEMITGFRWHVKGACHYYGVVPDLVTFGKGMANGFSVAALGGKREIMQLGGLEHNKERVFLISTTHGAEMCSLGAFIETMNVYREYNVVQHIWKTGKQLMDGFMSIAKEYGIQDYFTMEGAHCSPNYVTKDANNKVSLNYRTLFHQEMLKNGVLIPWVALCYEHKDGEINFALDAARKALKIYRYALEDGSDKYLEGRSIKPVFRKYN